MCFSYKMRETMSYKSEKSRLYIKEQFRQIHNTDNSHRLSCAGNTNYTKRWCGMVLQMDEDINIHLAHSLLNAMITRAGILSCCLSRYVTFCCTAPLLRHFYISPCRCIFLPLSSVWKFPII